jgi:hypothetical protein
MTVQVVPDKPYATFRNVSVEAVAVNERTGLVYLANSDGSLSILDPQAARLTKTVMLIPSIDFKGRLAVNSDENLVYLAASAGVTGMGQAQVLVLDGTTLREIRAFGLELLRTNIVKTILPDFENGLLYLIYIDGGTPWQGHLLAVDIEQGREVARIPVLSGTSDVTLDRERGIVSLLEANWVRRVAALEELRAGTLERVAEYPLSLEGLRGITLGPGGDRLYASDEEGRILVIDPRTGAIIAERSVGVSAGKILIDQPRDRVLAPVRMAKGITKYVALSLDNLEPQGEVKIPLRSSQYGWINERSRALDGPRMLLFLAYSDGIVSVVNLANWAVVGEVAVSPRLTGIAYDPALRRAFLLSKNEAKLLAVELPGGRVREVPLPPEPEAIQADRSRHLLYVLSDRGRQVTVVDARSLTATRRIPLPLDWAASRLTLDTQRNRIFVASYQEFAAVDSETGKLLAAYQRPVHWEGPIALAVDSKTGDLYARHGGGVERFKGETLKPDGKLTDYAVSLTLDSENRRAYLGHHCYAKGCGSRTYVYDLDSRRRIASLEGTYGIADVNPGLGHLYIPSRRSWGISIVDAQTFDRAFTRAPADFLAVDSTLNEVLVFRKDSGTLTLYRDSLALSNPAAARLYPARIEILWPHGGARTQDASLANLAAMVFRPGTLDPVDERWQNRLELWVSINNSPAKQMAIGKRRWFRSYPVWDFNDVDVSPAWNEETTMIFFLRSSGRDIASTIWSHGVDGRTRFPHPPSPTGLGTSQEVDTLIRIVWPHDRQGAPVGVLDADYVNISVSVFAHGTNLSVPPDWDGQVTLYRALNNGPLQPVGRGTKRLVKEGSLTYPIWEFNNVEVSQARAPQTKYYFLAMVEGVPTYPSVWSHGYDARTILPHPDFRVN